MLKSIGLFYAYLPTKNKLLPGYQKLVAAHRNNKLRSVQKWSRQNVLLSKCFTWATMLLPISAAAALALRTRCKTSRKCGGREDDLVEGKHVAAALASWQGELQFHGPLSHHYGQAVKASSTSVRQKNQIWWLMMHYSNIWVAPKNGTTLIASALSNDSIAESGSPKFNCALPSVTQACKNYQI
jgi:hypothetical protein